MLVSGVWDEFSEIFLENRVPTSADFNTYPIRILVDQPYKAILGEFLVLTKWIIVPPRRRCCSTIH